MTVRASDEWMHENTSEPNFNESMYCNFFDHARAQGGFVRVGNRPNEGYAEVTIALYRPDGTALFNYKRPEITGNDRLESGGMSFRVVEPLRHLQVSYRGKAVFLTQPLDLADPKRAFTENPFLPVELDLDLHGLSPIFGGEAEDNHLAASGLVFARGHYEQHVRATGRLKVGSAESPVTALGLRDHSWGPRSWQSPLFYRWLTCQFDESFGFMASQIVTGSGAEILGGFVFRDGRVDPVRHVSIETEWREPGHYHQEIAAQLRTDQGELSVVGRVLTILPLRNRRDGHVTRISEGFTQWRCGNAVGYGISEYLDQMV